MSLDSDQFIDPKYLLLAATTRESAKFKKTEILKFHDIAKKYNIEVELVHLLDNENTDDLYQRKRLPYACILISQLSSSTPWSRNKIDLLLKLEDKGVKFINKFNNHVVAYNKWLMYERIKNSNIPTPKTILLPPRIDLSDKDFGKKIIHQVGLPVVIKVVESGFGIGIVKIETESNLSDLLGLIYSINHFNSPIIAQEYINKSAGKAIRVIVLNGQCLAAMYKENPDSWKSNSLVSNYRILEKYPIDDNLEKICLETCQILGLDFAGIDLHHLGNQEYSLGEVNSYPMLEHIDYKFPEINIITRVINFLMPHATQVNAEINQHQILRSRFRPR